MEWSDIADIADLVGIIRDVFFVALLLLAIFVLIVAYRRVKRVLDSAERTLGSVEEVADALSSRFAKPASSESRVAYVVGKIAAFVLGLFKKKRETQEEGRKD